MPKERDVRRVPAGERPDIDPLNPPVGSSPGDPFGQDPNLHSHPASDYPMDTLPVTANPAADEKGFDAVDPDNAVGAPEPRRYSERSDEPLTREQWQSSPQKGRPEWKHPVLGGVKR